MEEVEALLGEGPDVGGFAGVVAAELAGLLDQAFAVHFGKARADREDGHVETPGGFIGGHRAEARKCAGDDGVRCLHGGDTGTGRGGVHVGMVLGNVVSGC